MGEVGGCKAVARVQRGVGETLYAEGFLILSREPQCFSQRVPYAAFRLSC